MGLGPAAIKLYLELWQQGRFENIRSVADMGSQEIHLTKEAFDSLVKTAGITDYKEENFCNLAGYPQAQRVSAGVFYKMLGAKEYACVDLNGTYGAIKQDLNLPLADKSLFGRFDLITDHGNNEHAFNIAEAYRTMHRLCSPGGVMVIEQAAYNSNGYYLFDPSFFEGMAAANNYRVLFSSSVITVKDKNNIYPQFHIPLSRQLLEAINYAKIDSIGTCYVFQKQSADDFRYPYQGSYLSRMQKNMGYHLQHLLSPPGYNYVPLYSKDLNNVGTKTLLRVLSARFPQIIKSVFKEKWIKK